jgi:hypothetical protein
MKRKDWAKITLQFPLSGILKKAYVAGAISVLNHILSPMSAGLFRWA